MLVVCPNDRFLIIDGVECYLVGASLKAVGKKGFNIACIEDNETVRYSRMPQQAINRAIATL